MALDYRRRKFLKYGGLVAGTTLAGCTGGDGGDGGGDGDGGDGSGGDGGDGGGDGGDGGGDGGDGGGDGGDGGEPQTIQMYGIDEFETRAVGEGFNEETGHTIETTVLLGGENAGRYIREHEQGVHTADLVQGFDQNFFPLIDEGLVADPELPNKDAVFPDEYEDFLVNTVFSSFDNSEQAGNLVPLCGLLGGFCYNPNLVDDPPTSYEDLLDPRFEDEIVMLAYNVDGWYDHLSREHDEEYAADFIVQLDEQNPEYISDSPLAAVQQVGAGQYMLAPDSFASHVEMFKGQGLPVDWSWGEFTWRQSWGIALTDTAPRFDAAQEFCHYVATEDGQRAMSQIFGGAQPFHENLDHPNDTIQQRLEEQDPTIRPQAPDMSQEEYFESRVEELIGI